jgi:ABC-2 family transporter protein
MSAPQPISPPPLPPPPAPLQPLRLHPTLRRALRAIWLFTWRPQLTWRRLPLHLLNLLILPVLVYLTIPSETRWLERRSMAINPILQVNQFARRVARSGHRLSREQREHLLQVFTEESQQLPSAPPQAQSGEAALDRQRQAIGNCYQRIRQRAQTILDDAQQTEFRRFAQRSMLSAQREVRPAWGRTDPFYHWLFELYFFVLLPLVCVRGCGGLIRDELQADTLGFLLTRPLTRARLLVMKYIAQTAWLQLLLVAETLLLFAAGLLRQLHGLGSLLPLFLGVQLLAVPAWCALGIFLGQVTKRYMPLALLYGLIVEMGIGRIPTNINNLSLIRHLKTLLARNPTLQSFYDWNPDGTVVSLSAPLLATALFLTLAALLFTFHEYHQTAEMQK